MQKELNDKRRENEDALMRSAKRECGAGEATIFALLAIAEALQRIADNLEVPGPTATEEYNGTNTRT